MGDPKGTPNGEPLKGSVELFGCVFLFGVPPLLRR